MKRAPLLFLIGISLSSLQAHTVTLSLTGTINTFHKALQAAADLDTIYIRQGVYECINETVSKPELSSGKKQ